MEKPSLDFVLEDDRRLEDKREEEDSREAVDLAWSVAERMEGAGREGVEAEKRREGGVGAED